VSLILDFFEMLFRAALAGVVVMSISAGSVILFASIADMMFEEHVTDLSPDSPRIENMT